eukprot:Gregarina_sp_Poly_1__1442@NODE_135_length_13154_cov_22_841446_g120_i0_p7_GENE_NODE_135_length_13154_cov_22_841446_g120_i0NODE_135_length_13154_cov_22_841446_g120_i0_p7_ORF_typecomplete_len201_score39_38_NODE_135_length_13154_cov_22_841446_g120_i026233225
MVKSGSTKSKVRASTHTKPKASTHAKPKSNTKHRRPTKQERLYGLKRTSTRGGHRKKSAPPKDAETQLRRWAELEMAKRRKDVSMNEDPSKIAHSRKEKKKAEARKKGNLFVEPPVVTGVVSDTEFEEVFHALPSSKHKDTKFAAPSAKLAAPSAIPSNDTPESRVQQNRVPKAKKKDDSLQHNSIKDQARRALEALLAS